MKIAAAYLFAALMAAGSLWAKDVPAEVSTCVGWPLAGSHGHTER